MFVLHLNMADVGGGRLDLRREGRQFIAQLEGFGFNLGGHAGRLALDLLLDAPDLQLDMSGLVLGNGDALLWHGRGIGFGPQTVEVDPLQMELFEKPRLLPFEPHRAPLGPYADLLESRSRPRRDRVVRQAHPDRSAAATHAGGVPKLASGCGGAPSEVACQGKVRNFDGSSASATSGAERFWASTSVTMMAT